MHTVLPVAGCPSGYGRKADVGGCGNGLGVGVEAAPHVDLPHVLVELPKQVLLRVLLAAAAVEAAVALTVGHAFTVPLALIVPLKTNLCITEIYSFLL